MISKWQRSSTIWFFPWRGRFVLFNTSWPTVGSCKRMYRSKWYSALPKQIRPTSWVFLGVTDILSIIHSRIIQRQYLPAKERNLQWIMCGTSVMRHLLIQMRSGHRPAYIQQPGVKNIQICGRLSRATKNRPDVNTEQKINNIRSIFTENPKGLNFTHELPTGNSL